MIRPASLDLSILGQPHQRFNEYETQIRQEHSWVPKLIYRFERGKILKRFLAREKVFKTELFQQTYEVSVRRNLQSLLTRLI